jgi:methylmalonyl-CoA/ethylmalonyl-CoA epimerase
MFSILKIHHVAIVVDNLEDPLSFWRDALKLELEHIEDVSGQESLVAFLPVGGSEIELVEPTSSDSGVAKYLAKRGPGMHHICMQVDDLDACLNHLKKNDVRLINEEPVTGAGGSRVAFVHPEATHGVLVELYEVGVEAD